MTATSKAGTKTTRKAAPKTTAKAGTKTTRKAAPKTTAKTGTNGGTSVAAVDSGVRVWFERLSDFELPTIDLENLELPTIELPQVTIPNRDDVRLTVVRVLDDIQDAVMTAPTKAQDIVVDLRESLTKSVVLVREAVGI